MGYERDEDYKGIDLEKLRIVVEAAQKRYISMAEGRMLYFSQRDIHAYQDTKAAAYTMIDCLLEMAGCEAGDLERCCLSGAFPAHSDLEAAITIGIFPDLPRERYSCIANTSLEGARILLLDRDRLQEVEALAEGMYCVQFASVPDFLVRMQAAKFLPHTDRERFPSVEPGKGSLGSTD